MVHVSCFKVLTNFSPCLGPYQQPRYIKIFCTIQCRLASTLKKLVPNVGLTINPVSDDHKYASGQFYENRTSLKTNSHFKENRSQGNPRYLGGISYFRILSVFREVLFCIELPECRTFQDSAHDFISATPTATTARTWTTRLRENHQSLLPTRRSSRSISRIGSGGRTSNSNSRPRPPCRVHRWLRCHQVRSPILHYLQNLGVGQQVYLVQDNLFESYTMLPTWHANSARSAVAQAE